MLVNDHAHLSGQVTHADLEALRHLRAELGEIFTAAATGREHEAVRRMNALLVRCPIQPELVSHDDQRWHVHLAHAGSIADRFAAGAVIGLTLMVSQFGFGRLGTCSIASCARVFIDASPGRSRRYCAEHGATRANVAAIRAQTAPTAQSRQDDTAVRASTAAS
jgi:predicted RNA-binding Zn ribbon-like protein